MDPGETLLDGLTEWLLIEADRSPARPRGPQAGARARPLRALRPVLGLDGGVPAGGTRGRRARRCARGRAGPGRRRAGPDAPLRPGSARRGWPGRASATETGRPVRGGRSRISRAGPRRVPRDRAAGAGAGRPARFAAATPSRSSRRRGAGSRSGSPCDPGVTPPTAVEGLASGLRGPFPGSLLVTGPTSRCSRTRVRRSLPRCSVRATIPSAAATRAAGRRLSSWMPTTTGRRSTRTCCRVEPDGVQIRVDQVREALAFAAGRPYESPRRVAVVWHAELLGVEAGNALLKSLEEPGSAFHWILATARPEVLLPTIRSRCAVLPGPASPPGERIRAWRDAGRERRTPPISRCSSAGGRARRRKSSKTFEAGGRPARGLAAARRALAGSRRAILLAEIVGKGKPQDVSLFSGAAGRRRARRSDAGGRAPAPRRGGRDSRRSRRPFRARCPSARGVEGGRPAPDSRPRATSGSTSSLLLLELALSRV